MMNPLWTQKGSLAESFWKNGTPADCPIYDMHAHMGGSHAIYFKHAEAADMAAHAARTGVKRILCCHHQVLNGGLTNAEAVEMCLQFPDLFRVYIGINPHYPEDIERDLKLADKYPGFIVGIKMLAKYHQIPVDAKEYAYALDFANERKMLVLNHTCGFCPYDGADHMENIIRHRPDATFLIGHCLQGDWDNATRIARDYPNAYLELTAMPNGNGVVKLLVDGAGSEKILYGTDLPWFDEYSVVGGILGDGISDEDVRNILYRNAQKILGEKVSD